MRSPGHDTGTGRDFAEGRRADAPSQIWREEGSDGPSASEAVTVPVPPGFFDGGKSAIVAKDVLLLAALPGLTAIAWLIPDALSLRMSRALARLLHRLQPRRYEGFGRTFRENLPRTLDKAALDELVVESIGLHHLERLQLLRHHLPNGWRPKTELAGQEHLEHALAQGKGVILWVTFATFSDTVSKFAFWQEGHPVWHLSRHTHGHMSSSRFGSRFLNPIRTSIERRYLAERVVIDPVAPKEALARLTDLLKRNRIVSITVGVEARQVTRAPFAKGSLALAGGAPALALKTGAALLPVFTERRTDGSFLVTIEPPLRRPATGSREQKVASMVAQQLALMSAHFERLPSQFHCHSLRCFKDRLEKATEQRPDPSTIVRGAAAPSGAPLVKRTAGGPPRERGAGAKTAVGAKQANTS